MIFPEEPKLPQVSSPLPPEALAEFKELYRKHYGEELSDEQVSKYANNLVGLYGLVYGSSAQKIKESDN